MKISRQHCEDYLNNNVRINNILDNNRFTVKFRISSVVNSYNKTHVFFIIFTIVEYLHSYHDDHKKDLFCFA